MPKRSADSQCFSEVSLSGGPVFFPVFGVSHPDCGPRAGYVVITGRCFQEKGVFLRVSSPKFHPFFGISTWISQKIGYTRGSQILVQTFFFPGALTFLMLSTRGRKIGGRSFQQPTHFFPTCFRTIEIFSGIFYLYFLGRRFLSTFNTFCKFGIWLVKFKIFSCVSWGMDSQGRVSFW